MTDVTWLIYAADFVTIWVFLPQLVKSLKTKKTRDLSMPTVLLQILSLLLWLSYGLVKGDTTLIACNAIALPIGIGVLAAKMRYG